MPSYLLVLEYDGSGFEGWQAQPEDTRTVQGCLEAAIEQITGERVRVTGSGRTDAGVHAEGQVASFTIAKDLEAGRLCRALNGVLPRDVGVREARCVPDGFDAQRDARGKRYRYRIWNGPQRSPLRERRFAHVPQPLDLAAMRRAAAVLVGTHDFSSFRAAGSHVKTSTRTLHALELTGSPGGEVELLLDGSGFLRHMVRNIAGTLIEVGLGRRSADDVAGLLAARDRTQAGRTAPAHGLTLEAVRYAEQAAGGPHSPGKPPP